MKSISEITSVILLCIVVSAGCGPAENGISTPAGEDTLNSPSDSVLLVSDTISIDLLSDFGIASVDDIDATESGLIALLDGTQAIVTVISDSGDFIARTGGSGSGPGEFQWPGAISISENGFIAVSDLMAGIVRILEPDLESYRDLSGFMMSNPGAMHLMNDSSFAGMRITFRSDNGNTLIGVQTAFWSADKATPVLIYEEDMETFTPGDFGRSFITPYPMTCSSDGKVFTADVSSEKYVLNSFLSDGTLRWRIEYPFQQTDKTQLEIRTEEDMVVRRMAQTAHQADYTADPYHYAVSSLAMDANGLLWARRPGSESAFYDVYDGETGRLLFTASLGEELYPSRLEITRGGILAVTAGETPSLVKLSLSSPDQLN